MLVKLLQQPPPSVRPKSPLCRVWIGQKEISWTKNLIAEKALPEAEQTKIVPLTAVQIIIRKVRFKIRKII